MSESEGPDRDEVVKLYDAQIAAHPVIQRKGAANPYTSANGHMFSFVNKAREVGIRLSKEDQKAFFEEFDSGPFISYGATMRGYVTVPLDTVKSDLFQKYLDMSYDYVTSLPPKPTKKPPKKK